jgi:hypothetical protein
MPLVKKYLKIKNIRIKSGLLIVIQVMITAILAEVARNVIKQALPSQSGQLIAASGGITFGLSSFMMQDSLRMNVKSLGLC